MNLKTGFKELDNKIGGLKEKELIALVSRQGMGKSTLAINIINNIAKQTKDKILYFNLETSKERLKEKIVSDNVEIIDTPNITVEQIKKKCEEISKNGLKLIVIDYIQLVRPTTFIPFELKIMEHTVEVLKEISLELNIPIIVLSGLTKQQAESLYEDCSTKFDYQANSPLLQKADKVIFLYRKNYYNSKEQLTSLKDNENYFKEVKVLACNIVMAIIE